MSEAGNIHRIVVVGGGAGGLVLATRLGRRLGRKGRAQITLVDAAMSHVWKPLLHEVAVGTLDSGKDDVMYLSHANNHSFRFQQGRMEGLDRERREVLLEALTDSEGEEIIPPRRLPYDTLVMAVGSVCNDFGVPGVAENCLFLDTHLQADQVQRRILAACIRAQNQDGPLAEGQLQVGIVGAGATGVELAAELHRATRQLVSYGLDRIDPEKDVKISLVEAAPRVLPALPERVSEATERELRRLGVEIYTGEQVTEVSPTAISAKSGLRIPAELKIWSAGVKAPPFLADIGGLETNGTNQLVVKPTLQTTRDENIYAMGDCASCPQSDSDRPVPPRAQAAYQQAVCLTDTLCRRLEGKPPVPFEYHDHGSLVSLTYSSVGQLMGNLMGNITVEGFLARMAYLSLYKKHQLSLHGFVWVALATLTNLIRRRTEPRLKLH